MDSIEKFFTGKYFVIPNYQRDYAWGRENIDDLFEDIFESIETETSHYIGTFILSKNENEEEYKVVDGQQRLTTITMIINAVINNLTDETDKIIFKDKYVFSRGAWKLELLNENKEYFRKLLNDESPIIENKSQKLLEEAYNHIKSRISNLSERNISQIEFLNAITNLETMEFLEKNDGKAIRIFQTVNDRGRPLSNMEKAKSLLIYYSNRFLDAELDDVINEKFGGIFKNFNQIKELGEEYDITLISQKRFNEDSVMRYHFLAFQNDHYDYNATINDVLEIFLKSNLKTIKTDTNLLRIFITKYIEDLSVFFSAFLDIVKRLSQTEYYKIFAIQDISAFLYPLLIRLETRKLLNKQSGYLNYTFLELIELADMRVYKIRGTDPAKDISLLAKDSSILTEEEIKNKLIGFINNFMNNNEFKNRLEGNIYGNRALRRIFIEFDEYINGSSYDLNKLININKSIPTVEHIFPQEEAFDFPSHGFDSIDEYLNKIHNIGNLLLLEKTVNSSCKNRNPEIKISDSKYYERSNFKAVIDFVSKMRTRDQSFSSNDIIIRTTELSCFAMETWKM